MANFSKKSKIADAGEGPKRRIKVGFKTLTESLPACWHRKMVSPSGGVKRVVLGTRTDAGLHGNEYGSLEIAEKLEKGWLIYSECPLRHGVSIEGETPCDGPDPERPGMYWTRHPENPGWLVEDHCCPHIEQAIEERQKEHAEKQAEFARAFLTTQDKMFERLVDVTESEVQTQINKRKPGRHPKTNA